jgi:hypothetical protein
MTTILRARSITPINQEPDIRETGCNQHSLARQHVRVPQSSRKLTPEISKEEGDATMGNAARGTPWLDYELDVIVEDYFSMLASEMLRQPYVKSKHSKVVMERTGRSHRSVEFKHQNISAVLSARYALDTWLSPQGELSKCHL